MSFSFSFVTIYVLISLREIVMLCNIYCLFFIFPSSISFLGESVNRSSIIVSDELVSPLDLTLIIFVLLLWATTILMCINKWGKIRMLEPYQPSFQASDDDDYSSTTTATAKKTTPVVGNIRVPSTSCKSTLNRSTIRIIPSEADLVNMHDSIVIGMGRSLDVGIGPTIGGYGSKVRADYCNNHSPGGIGLNGNTGNGGCGGSESESVNNGLVSNGNGNGGGEIINIPRIEISPICWSDERKCKSLEDVRVRLLS